MGHTCISLFLAPPSPRCWMKAQMLKKWVWFKVGGQASQAKPRHFKPSRPLLLEQVLICGDSEMLQRQWTHSPHTHTHMNKHVPADLFCRCVCAHLFDWSFHKPLSQPGMKLRWVRFDWFLSVCACLLLSQWAVFQSSKGILQKSLLMELIKYQTSLAFQESIIQ